MSAEPANTRQRDVAIRLRDIGKTYRLYQQPIHRLWEIFRGPHPHTREHHALAGIDLDIYRGETFGIVGRNGSGKSTMLRIICGILAPTQGTLEVRGRIAPLLALGAGFNPEFTGRENVRLNATVLGLSPREIAARFDSIAEFADIGDAIEQPVRTYSSGMYARLAFAVAACVDPEILVVDEIISVGDELFARKCFARIEDLRKRGTTILFVSHSARTILQNCDRALLLDHGRQVMLGDPREVIRAYHSLLYTGTRFSSELSVGTDLASATPSAERPAAAEAEAAEPSSDTEDGWFDRHLVPITTNEYPSRGARIGNITITNRHGEPRNRLRLGFRYFVSYTVHFERGADQLLFGMNVTDRGGVVVGGLAQPAPLVHDGDTMTVRFPIDVRMLPGTYFLTVGIRSQLEEGFLHRIIDALAFAVLPDRTEWLRFGAWALDASGTKISLERDVQVEPTA
ncbi:MAG: ABC transporter ATP-binding protein [Phycisphaerales bacterium]